MRIKYTDEALRDLEAIVEFIELHYPAILFAFEQRPGAVESRIARGPKSAKELFYRIQDDTIEVLHLRHAARQEPWEDGDG